MNISDLKPLVDKKLSTRDIAKLLNCSQTNVIHWLKKHGMKTDPSYHDNLKLIPRKCVRCGETDPNKFYGNKRSYCGKCHNQITIKRGQENKNKIVEFLGGKCIHCGYNEFNCSLDLHHLDPSKKGLVIKGIMVLIDRQEGGKEALENLGYRVQSLFTKRELLQFYSI